MSTYSVQFGPMQEAYDGLQAVHSRLTEMVNDLNNQVSSGTVDFQGDTREQFLQVHREYNQNHDELTNALRNANTSLAQIQTAYTGAETRGSQLWG